MSLRHRGRAPLIEITTASEASVFRTIEVTASAIVALAEQGQDASAVQLFLATSNRSRARRREIFRKRRFAASSAPQRRDHLYSRTSLSSRP